jgi:iron complex outermembrane receptor protein
MSHLRKVLPFAASTALSIISAQSLAEPSPEASADGERLETIVVTAQKREESLQEVPISISAVDANRIARDLDGSPGDIARVVPNLYGNPTGGRSARPRWFLRGVGVNTSSLVSPIGVYFDEVYQSALELHSFPLFDLDRVEVLRGPQGTLWGKNTPGGAIHFVTKKPDFNTDGYVKVGFGNLDQKEVQGAVGGSIIDGVLAGRVSYLQEERGGWARNRYTGDKKAGAYDDSAVRAQLLFTPTDSLEALVNVHHRNIDSQGVPGYNIGINEGGADNFGYVSPVGPNPRIGDPIDRNNDASGEQESLGGSLTVKWQLGDYVLTSITAYEEVDSATAGDREHSPNEVIRTYAIVDSHQFSQELRLASNPDDRLSWIGGLYYFKDSQYSDSTSATLPSTPQVFGTFYQNTQADVDTESYAAFLNATYQVTDAFKLNGGLRWTRETIGIDLNGVDGGPRGSTNYVNTEQWWRRNAVTGPLRLNAFQREENTWKAWTFDVTPSYRVTDDVLAYARLPLGRLQRQRHGAVVGEHGRSRARGLHRSRCQSRVPEWPPDDQRRRLLLRVEGHAAQHPGCDGCGAQRLDTEERGAGQGARSRARSECTAAGTVACGIERRPAARGVHGLRRASRQRHGQRLLRQQVRTRAGHHGGPRCGVRDPAHLGWLARVGHGLGVSEPHLLQLRQSDGSVPTAGRLHARQCARVVPHH